MEGRLTTEPGPERAARRAAKWRASLASPRKGLGETFHTAVSCEAKAEFEKIQEQAKDAETLASFAIGYWIWDATYARGRRARRKSLSPGTLDTAESNTRDHIIPG